MLSTVIGYIDVSTGSYLLTAIAGGFATVWFFLRTKIDRILGRRPTEPSAGAEAAPTEVTADSQAAEQKQE
jgi:hypothetical protein